MDEFLRCSRGSILVETAFILPLFFLLIFVGTDLVRLVELTARVNQAVAVIADNLSREEFQDETEFSDSLKLADHIISMENAENYLFLEISAISSHPTVGTVVLWTRSFSEGEVSCNTLTPEFDTNSTEAQESKKIGFFVVVNLCVMPGESFFLSQLYLAQEMRLRSLSISVASHPSIRIPD